MELVGLSVVGDVQLKWQKIQMAIIMIIDTEVETVGVAVIVLVAEDAWEDVMVVQEIALDVLVIAEAHVLVNAIAAVV